MLKYVQKKNCKGNPLIVMVTASPTTNHTKCRTKHVVLQTCNGACLINHIYIYIYIYINTCLFTWNSDSHCMDWWIFMKFCIEGPLLKPA
jgi:hypothetical protein